MAESLAAERQVFGVGGFRFGTALFRLRACVRVCVCVCVCVIWNCSHRAVSAPVSSPRSDFVPVQFQVLQLHTGAMTR